jgi:hypothetical protein
MRASGPGYARRKGIVGDIVLRGSTRVVVIGHRDQRRHTWPVEGTELLEFGSFNPKSHNYQPGGRPWVPRDS